MENYLLMPFVEIEIRLGTICKDSFDASVDKRYFEKIKESLESGNCWKTIVRKETTEYCKDNLKMIDKLIILKENILKKDTQLKSSPFDIRFAINQEFKTSSVVSKDDCVIRIKNRTSFVADDFQYDLTIVNEKKNGINKLKYEIEIELLVNKNTLLWENKYINDYLECKVYDLINIVEPSEREEFKITL